MKKYLSILFIFVLLFPLSIKAESININSENAVMINLNNNEIIYEKNKDEVIKVASMQKVMTALVAIENIDNLDESFVLDYNIFDGLDSELAVAGFSGGDRVTYNDLLYATLLRSGADGAYGLAVKVSGSEAEFVKLMNKKAEELGLKNTHFTNSTGLDDDDQFSTVYDMAILLKYALNNSRFKKIISTEEYTTTNGEITVTGPVHKAKTLGMDYFNGGKTGYTDLAGLCLMSYASYDDVDYLLVTGRAPESMKNQNFLDQKTLYDYFMENYSFQTIIKKNKVIKKIKTMYDDEVTLKTSKNVSMYINNNVFQNELEYIYEGEDVLKRGVKKGDKIGKYIVKNKDKVLYEEDVLSPITVKFKLKTPYKIVLIIILVSMFIHLRLRNLRRKRRRKRRR